MRSSSRPIQAPDRAQLPERRQLAPVAEDEQPHRIEQDQQRADLVEDRGGDRTEDAERGREHRHGVESEGEADDVLPDDGDRLAGQADQVRQHAQRVAQHDQVAGLGGQVGADAAQARCRHRPGPGPAHR